MSFRAITATLELRTALHVGTGEGTETVDDLLHRDTRGRLLIPGTALAGGLRSIATRLAPRFQNEKVCLALTGKESKFVCGCLVCKLFGDMNPQEDDTVGNVARILIYDALPNKTDDQCKTIVSTNLTYNVLPNKTDVQVRDGVGIDRVTGAAARRERSKFDLEVLAAQTTFQLRIEVDNKLFKDAKQERILHLLAATLAEWQAGRGAIGGRVGRGLGALTLKDMRWIDQNLNQKATLIEFLKNGPQWETKVGNDQWVEQQLTKARPTISSYRAEHQDFPVARSWAVAEFTLAATGPFLTHDLVQAGRSGFDHAPVLAAYKKCERPVLPGSSLRGVLRSQAERIARTISTLDAWNAASDASGRTEYFRGRCPACHPLGGKIDQPVASCNSLIKALPRSERDKIEQFGADEKLCLACYLFGSTWNGSRLRVEDAPLQAGTDPVYKVLDFVAIDRFTGGARNSAKFDATVLWQPRFSVRLFLDNPEPWELGWLALTLRDLQDGFATVGYGAAKGFGRCKIEHSKLTLGILHDSDFPLPGPLDDESIDLALAAGEVLSQQKSGDSGLYQTVAYDASRHTDWLVLASGWVTAFNRKVKGHERKKDFVIKEDSYFVEDPKTKLWLSDLYPVRAA